ncbi:universal stress protein [Streptomyces sp. SCL15-6]|uniref:universal stress protein n=1 Tax=Streptomyces sp. SCL15-6 TaxID=2967222 RepID=UPI0029668B68|nr:universal stress protein [Streptomyces sp. SCL15-6]
MKLPVVVGVDGSEASLRAAEWAADEAALRELPLRIVYASLWERYEGTALSEDLGEPWEEVRAQDIVDTAARRAERGRPTLQVTTDILPEEAEHALVGEGRNASLLVVGTRGRGGLAEFLLGSTSLGVAGRADCPVVVLRGSHDNQTARPVQGRVVVGVGEGADDAVVIRFAAEEALRRGVPLEAVCAWRRPAHEMTEDPLTTGKPARTHEQRAVEALDAALADVPPEVQVRRHTVEGHARRILEAASREADLLVVGSRHHRGQYGLQLGRVTLAVLHHSTCPVAVVRHS